MSVASSLPTHPRVLVVDLGFLGDTVHLVPALWDLRRNLPGADIHVVTTPVGAQVLGMVPAVNRVWVQPLGRPSPPWWRHLDLQWHLWRQRFDLSINFSGADRTLFVAAFSGARRRVTREARRYRSLQRLLAGVLLPAPPRSLPVYEQRRQCLAAAGFTPGEVRFDFAIPREAVDWAATRVPNGTVHLSINASSPFKEWPVPRWVELCHHLLREGMSSLVATGSDAPRERARLDELVRGVADARLRILEPPLSLTRLFAVVSRCRAHVGTDSGVTHVAWALGLPTVTVYRDYAGLEEWRPAGNRHEVVTVPCACAARPQPLPRCANAGIAACLDAVSAEAVATRVRRACADI